MALSEIQFFKNIVKKMYINYVHSFLFDTVFENNTAYLLKRA